MEESEELHLPSKKSYKTYGTKYSRMDQVKFVEDSF